MVPENLSMIPSDPDNKYVFVAAGALPLDGIPILSRQIFPSDQLLRNMVDRKLDKTLT